MFKTLEDNLGVFNDNGVIKSKVHNNNDEDPSQYDNHTVTYSEKVNKISDNHINAEIW